MTTTAQARHAELLAAMNSATTVAEMDAALAQVTTVDRPGFPTDSPAGHYFDGFFYATFDEDGHYAMTRLHRLPDATLDVMEKRRVQHRDEAEQATGPGRPAIGKPVQVRFPSWRLTQIDRHAAAMGFTRADAIRDLVAEGLRATRSAPQTVAAAVLAADYTYWVEIQHPGTTEWAHIHGVDWETADAYPDAWIYARQVRADHPGARVRVVERAVGRADVSGDEYIEVTV